MICRFVNVYLFICVTARNDPRFRLASDIHEILTEHLLHRADRNSHVSFKWANNGKGWQFYVKSNWFWVGLGRKLLIGWWPTDGGGVAPSGEWTRSCVIITVQLTDKCTKRLVIIGLIYLSSDQQANCSETNLTYRRPINCMQWPAYRPAYSDVN